MDIPEKARESRRALHGAPETRRPRRAGDFGCSPLSRWIAENREYNCGGGELNRKDADDREI